MREEMLEQDEPDDEDSGVDETSLSGVDNGDASDSDGLTGHYGEIADEDLLDEQNGEFEFGSQQDMPNDEDQMISFDPMLLGLKEINNLAHFSVSSHKPGNGVEELLSDDLSKYWQYVLFVCLFVYCQRRGGGREKEAVIINSSADRTGRSHTY